MRLNTQNRKIEIGCPKCGNIPIQDSLADENGCILMMGCQVCGHQCTPAQCTENSIEMAMNTMANEGNMEKEKPIKCPRCREPINLFPEKDNEGVVGRCGFCGATYTPEEIIMAMINLLLKAQREYDRNTFLT